MDRLDIRVETALKARSPLTRGLQISEVSERSKETVLKIVGPKCGPGLWVSEAVEEWSV
jgi:hypothetical protein